jgi:hypothetical protein
LRQRRPAAQSNQKDAAGKMIEMLVHVVSPDDASDLAKLERKSSG